MFFWDTLYIRILDILFIQTIKLNILQPLVHHELFIRKGEWIRFTSRGLSVENKFNWSVSSHSELCVSLPIGPLYKPKHPIHLYDVNNTMPQHFLLNILYERSTEAVPSINYTLFDNLMSPVLVVKCTEKLSIYRITI